jgi:hypothetical protein
MFLVIMVPKAHYRLAQRDRFANSCGYFIDEYGTGREYPGGTTILNHKAW